MSDSRNPVVEYICRLFVEEDSLLKNILERQLMSGGPMMNVGPDQGKLLYLLAKLINPQRVLEVGSYFGYSSVWLARALPSGAKLHCVEVSEPQCRVLEKTFIEAGLQDLVDVHQGSGVDLMQKFINEKKSFDLIFIDADKKNYPNYLKLADQLLISGGVLLVDNCLWNNKVLESNPDEQTRAIQKFNLDLASHKNFESTLITIQDGLVLAIKN